MLRKNIASFNITNEGLVAFVFVRECCFLLLFLLVSEMFCFCLRGILCFSGGKLYCIRERTILSINYDSIELKKYFLLPLCWLLLYLGNTQFAVEYTLNCDAAGVSHLWKWNEFQWQCCQDHFRWCGCLITSSHPEMAAFSNFLKLYLKCLEFVPGGNGMGWATQSHVWDSFWLQIQKSSGMLRGLCYTKIELGSHVCKAWS